MFSKKLKTSSIEELQIKIANLQENQEELIKRIRDQQHEVDKLHGHIRSLRGLVNRLRGCDLQPSEELNSSDPTDYLKRL